MDLYHHSVFLAAGKHKTPAILQAPSLCPSKGTLWSRMPQEQQADLEAHTDSLLGQSFVQGNCSGGTGEGASFTAAVRRAIMPRRSCQTVPAETASKSRHHFNLKGLWHREAGSPIQPYFLFLHADLFSLVTVTKRWGRLRLSPCYVNKAMLTIHSFSLVS